MKIKNNIMNILLESIFILGNHLQIYTSQVDPFERSNPTNQPKENKVYFGFIKVKEIPIIKEVLTFYL